MATPESKVKAKVKELLTRYGVWFFMPVTGGYGRAGVPDIIGVYKGRFLGIEVKAKGGKTTRLQEINLRDIAAQGGVSLVIEGDTGVEGLRLWLEDMTASAEGGGE